MIKVTVNDTQEFDIISHKDALEVNGQQLQPDLVRISENQYHLLLNDKSYRISILERPDDKHMVVEVNGNRYTLGVKDRFDLLLHDLGMDKDMGAMAEDVKAPMPGLVIDVLVEPGQEVAKDTPLLILEAMKMENVLKAAAPATVDAIRVKAKDAVEKGQVLIMFK